MFQGNNFSVSYFSIFTGDILHSKIKNQFISNIEAKKCYSDFKESNNILIKKIRPKSSSYIKCKTNSYSKKTNLKFFKDFIDPKKLKNKQRKNSLTQEIRKINSVEPYKQYILEKREIEENKKRREIEKKYINESRKQQELKILYDQKMKNEGYDFSRQEAKVGFLDKYIESKNYTKEKTKNFNAGRVFNYKKNKYQYIDIDLLEEIKANKRKNIFEEDFDLKTDTKYNSFRIKAVSFIKSLRHNPNYNYWIRKDK